MFIDALRRVRPPALRWLIIAGFKGTIRAMRVFTSFYGFLSLACIICFFFMLSSPELRHGGSVTIIVRAVREACLFVAAWASFLLFI